jgi:hypothetical protein
MRWAGIVLAGRRLRRQRCRASDRISRTARIYGARYLARDVARTASCLWETASVANRPGTEQKLLLEGHGAREPEGAVPRECFAGEAAPASCGKRRDSQRLVASGSQSRDPRWCASRRLTRCLNRGDEREVALPVVASSGLRPPRACWCWLRPSSSRSVFKWVLLAVALRAAA